MDAEHPARVYLSDVVDSGLALAVGAGEGPDGAKVIVWDEQREFTVWQTVDGTTWEPTDRLIGNRPIDLLEALVVGQQILVKLPLHKEGELISVSLPRPDLAVVTGDAGIEC